MVELRDVSLAFNLPRGEKVQALSGINARFEKGAVSAIIGPSGCGKTSLVRIMAALVSPNSGSVCIDGQALGEARKRAAVIFQDYGLLPWKTVFANAELALRFAARRSRGDPQSGRQKVKALLEEFGLARYAKLYPARLSGGMKQRLAIVRALAAESEILLMDEPFSSLDALTREDAQDFLLSAQKERRLTVIMVTHSIEEAAYMADFVYVMKGINPGTISERVVISRDQSLPRGGFRAHARYQEYCAALRSAIQPAADSGGKLP